MTQGDVLAVSFLDTGGRFSCVTPVSKALGYTINYSVESNAFYS